jgi:transcriptional regulator GlxA family with amidase domain
MSAVLGWGGARVGSQAVSGAADGLNDGLGEFAQIAHEAGFFDQSHFTRTFRRHFGLTSQAYRRVVRQ